MQLRQIRNELSFARTEFIGIVELPEGKTKVLSKNITYRKGDRNGFSIGYHFVFYIRRCFLYESN
jgi:hypothetical protein